MVVISVSSILSKPSAAEQTGVRSGKYANSNENSSLNATTRARLAFQYLGYGSDGMLDLDMFTGSLRGLSSYLR